MSSLNKVMIIGHLGSDPEVRSMANGGRVCNLSVATSEHWTEKATGERKSKSQWHKIVIFNDNLVTVSEKYLRKGSKVYVEGQLETRKWTDQQGIEKFSTEVVIKQFRGELTLLDSRKDGEHSQSSSYSTSPATSTTEVNSGLSTLARDLDDEIPF
jgi:single-strand DNA-binding protein